MNSLGELRTKSYPENIVRVVIEERHESVPNILGKSLKILREERLSIRFVAPYCCYHT